MKKRLRSFFYTSSKYVQDRNNEYGWKQINGVDDTLFAMGIYPTLIKKEDLPPYFIEGIIRRRHGWIDAKNFFDLVYRPNKFTNHAFKDDYLMISYTKGQKIEDGSTNRIMDYKGYDFLLWGFIIPEFVTAAKKYAIFDVSEIIEQIRDKLDWLEKRYPEEYKRTIENWQFNP